MIAAFSIVPILFMTEPPIEKQENHNILVRLLFINHFKESIELLYEDERILRFCIFYSEIFTMGSILYFYGQPYLYDIGFNRMEIGFVLMCAGIAAALGAFLVMRYTEEPETKLFRFKGVYNKSENTTYL